MNLLSLFKVLIPNTHIDCVILYIWAIIVLPSIRQVSAMNYKMLLFLKENKDHHFHSFMKITHFQYFTECKQTLYLLISLNI